MNKTFTPMGLIYEDELIELKEWINIIEYEHVDTLSFENKDLKRFKITISKKDKVLLKRIMTCESGMYKVRKR